MNEKFDKMAELLLEARGYIQSPTAIENIDIVISMIERVKSIVKMQLKENAV